MSAPRKMTGHEKGLRAEMWAGIFLFLKGYLIVARRYKSHVGEIDLVARRGRTIVFAEVKTRGSETSALESVHAENRARVRRCAELYLQRHPRYAGFDIRFDAVVFAGGWFPHHVENAF